MENYARIWPRAIADLIDSALLSGLSVLVVWLGLKGADWIFSVQLEQLNPVLVQLCLVGVRAGMALFYFTWMIYWKGTTVGKRIFKIYVVNSTDGARVTLKQSGVRFLAYAFSYLSLGVGYLMAAFHPRKQAFHDRMAGTVCLRRSGGDLAAM